MKSLFDSGTLDEVMDRIELLNESSKGLWGKMEVGQMLFHCQFPLRLALGKYRMKKPNFLMKFLFRSFKKSMYDVKLWKPNLPTAKGFKVLEDKEFGNEKNALIGFIKEFHGAKDKKQWDPHPAFGHFTPEQWGQMQYKHLDHHLRQFGV
ncbi:DUF1569 domain-containing protein [Flagellimonas sp.]|uniref:DUF1569 domain-containing protein n=1 Tax=Flagellimonas sp. TaxID=2058762 RepID=UPI003BB1B5B7